MILSLLTILTAFYWLLKETDYLRCNLMVESPKPIQMIEWRKHSPILEPCVIKTASYPKPKPILLLAEMCELTTIQSGIKKTDWRYCQPYRTGYKDCYQEMIIGGHTLTILATSTKLYDTIKEAVKVADNKPRKVSWTSPKLPLDAFVETVRTGSHNEYIPRKIFHEDGTVTDDPKHGFNQIVNEYKTYYKDCLCGKDWLEAHYQDHKDFEPTIELKVNEKSISFNGDFKSGKIREFIKANK